MNVFFTFIDDLDKMKIHFTLTEILFDGVLIQMCTEMALEICHLSKKLDFSRQRIQNTYVMQSFIISL